MSMGKAGRGEGECTERMGVPDSMTCTWSGWSPLLTVVVPAALRTMTRTVESQERNQAARGK